MNYENLGHSGRRFRRSAVAAAAEKAIEEGNFSITELSRRFHLSESYIGIILRSNGFSLKGQFVNPDKVEIRIEVCARFQSGESISKIARSLEMSDAQVRYILRRNGLVTIVSHEKRKEIIANIVAEAKEGAHPDELANKYNYNENYIRNVLKENGFVYNDREAIREEIADSIKDGESLENIVKLFDVSARTIVKACHEHDVDVPFGLNRFLAENCVNRETERNQEMIAMRKQGFSLREIGEKYGISRERVRQITIIIDAPCHKWAGLIKENSKAYKVWQAKKEKLCKEWREDFSLFVDFFKSNQTDDLILIAADKNKLISPDNFKFATRLEVQTIAHKKRSKKILAFGEKKTLREWTEDPRNSVSDWALRMRYGFYRWPMELALTVPKNARVAKFLKSGTFSFRDKNGRFIKKINTTTESRNSHKNEVINNT